MFQIQYLERYSALIAERTPTKALDKDKPASTWAMNMCCTCASNNMD